MHHCAHQCMSESEHVVGMCETCVIYQARETYSAAGQLSQLIVPPDRAPLAMFLAEVAEAKSHGRVRSLLLNIYQSSLALHQTSKSVMFIGRYEPLVRILRRDPRDAGNMPPAAVNGRGSEMGCRQSVLDQRSTGDFGQCTNSELQQIEVHSEDARLDTAEQCTVDSNRGVRSQGVQADLSEELMVPHVWMSMQGCTLAC